MLQAMLLLMMSRSMRTRIAITMTFLVVVVCFSSVDPLMLLMQNFLAM